MAVGILLIILAVAFSVGIVLIEFIFLSVLDAALSAGPFRARSSGLPDIPLAASEVRNLVL